MININRTYKNLIGLTAGCIVLLLISSATAVPHVHSKPVVQTINTCESTEEIRDISPQDIPSKFNTILHNKQFKEFSANIEQALEKKLGATLLATATNKIYELLANKQLNKNVPSYVEKLVEKASNALPDDPEPQIVIDVLIVVLLALYLIGIPTIGLCIVFPFYFATTPSAGWVQRTLIALTAAVLWPVSIWTIIS